MKNKKPLLISAVLLFTIVGIGFFFTMGGGRTMGNIDFSKINNNNFDNKGKYDYMKKSTSFQPTDKKKHSPSVLRWKN